MNSLVRLTLGGRDAIILSSLVPFSDNNLLVRRVCVCVCLRVHMNIDYFIQLHAAVKLFFFSYNKKNIKAKC